MLIELSLRHLGAHDCLRVYQGPKSATIQDDLSQALFQITAEAMSGHDNDCPSGRRYGASNHDQWPLANAEYALKASARPRYASKYDTVQDSAKSDLVNCPSRHNDKGTAGHAIQDVPGIQTATCTKAL